MIYVYIIRVMTGSAGGNRPTGSMARIALGLTIAIPAVAAKLAAEEFRCQVQHWDIGLRGTVPRCAGWPWVSTRPPGSKAGVEGSLPGDAGRTLQRLRGETRTGALPDREFARQLRLQEEVGIESLDNRQSRTGAGGARPGQRG